MLVQDTHVRFVTGTRSKTRFLCKVNKLKVRCIHISHLNLNNLHNVLSHNNYSVSCKYKTLHVFQKLLQAFRLLSEVSLVSSTGDAFAHLIIWHCKRNEFGELYLNIYTKHILLTAPYKSCRSHSPSYCVQKLLRLDAIRGKIVQFLAKHVLIRTCVVAKCFQCVAHVVIINIYRINEWNTSNTAVACACNIIANANALQWKRVTTLRHKIRQCPMCVRVCVLLWKKRLPNIWENSFCRIFSSFVKGAHSNVCVPVWIWISDSNSCSRLQIDSEQSVQASP